MLWFFSPFFTKTPIEKENACVLGCERERKRVCVPDRERVHVRERVHARVCMRVWERVRLRSWERERKIAIFWHFLMSVVCWACSLVAAWVSFVKGFCSLCESKPSDASQIFLLPMHSRLLSSWMTIKLGISRIVSDAIVRNLIKDCVKFFF